MNILMIAPTPFFSDRQVRIYQEVLSLKKLGHQVTVCTYHIGRNVPGIDVRRIFKVPWYKKIEAGPSLHKVYLDLILFFKSLSVAYRIKPDIIHGHLHEGALIGYFISKTIRKPFIFDMQGSLSAEIKAHNFLTKWPLVHKLFQTVEKIIDKMPPMIVLPSTDELQKLRKDFGIPEGKLALVSDGADTEIFKPGLDVKDLRRDLNLTVVKTVVYLGLLTEFQGIDCLLEAVPHVLDDVNDVHFLIMGYPNVDKYREKANKLGISERVTFTGRIDYDKAARYLLLGDVAVAPKLVSTEGNGKIYNYMACGLPTVVFDTPVNRQILGELGIYAEDVGNPVSLAKALKSILMNDELASQLRPKLREHAINYSSWDATAEKLVDCYHTIIADFKRDRSGKSR